MENTKGNSVHVENPHNFNIFILRLWSWINIAQIPNDSNFFLSIAIDLSPLNQRKCKGKSYTVIFQIDHQFRFQKRWNFKFGFFKYQLHGNHIQVVRRLMGLTMQYILKGTAQVWDLCLQHPPNVNGLIEQVTTRDIYIGFPVIPVNV